MAGAISTFIRAHADDIVREWIARARREIPEGRSLSRPALIDHLPELISAVADWVDDDRDAARRGFDRLAEGHAVQRLGYGLTLESLIEEYAVMREIILTRLLEVPAIVDDVREDLVRFNLGMDEAITESVRRYAQRRDEIRERFIGILGHDLRNPLGAITMAAEVMVRDEELPPRHLAIGARILRGADRMRQMVEELLGFAQGHLGGGIPAEPTPGDMGELARAAVEEVGAAYPERTVRLATSGDLRGAWDHARVHQALSNLIGNAVHHGDGTITVTVDADGDSFVRTEVHNRGEPIPADAMPTLFDPFRRHLLRARKYEGGLGLGLYIVDQIAAAHGATIDVASSADDGTRFVLRWPRTIPGHPGANPDLRGGS
jgi:signal transduction histidine kinase